MFNYIDTFSPKIDGLLIRRSCEPYPGKRFTISLSGALLPNGDYQYKLDVPGRFGSSTVRRGPLDEILVALEDTLTHFVETFDPEEEEKHEEKLKFMGQNFYRATGKEKKRPSRR